LKILSAYDSPAYIAWSLVGYAAALSAEENYIQSTGLCAAAARLREKEQTPLPPPEHDAFEQTIGTIKSELGTKTFEGEWKIGSLLSQDQAIKYA
jgi:hypothetical protein